MTIIEEYQDNLDDWFNNDKERYRDEVSACEAMTSCTFNPECPAHVFSGHIDSIRIAFLTMNPKESDDGCANKLPIGASKQKTNFELLKNDYYPTFEKMNHIAAGILNKDVVGWYNVLDSDCADIDFIPFYSKNSGFDIDESDSKFKEQRLRLERYVSEEKIPYFVIIGESLRQVFNRLEGESQSPIHYGKPIGSTTDPCVILKENDSTRVAFVTPALTAYGMPEDFYKQFVPNAIRRKDKPKKIELIKHPKK